MPKDNEMDEIRKLLADMLTQVNGLEDYMRQLNELAHTPDMMKYGEKLNLGIEIRAACDWDGMIAMEIRLLRESIKSIEKELNKIL